MGPKIVFVSALLTHPPQSIFFVPCIVLDERRIQDKRRDCLVCCAVKNRVDSGDEEAVEKESQFDRYLAAYSGFLFQPVVQTSVILGFAALTAVCGYSASKLTQEFDATDILPSDSYVVQFRDAFQETTDSGSGVFPVVYFRFVNQSSPEVQAQMEGYLDDLVGLDEVSNQPKFFWLRDFHLFVNSTSSLDGLSFNRQMDAFLGHPVYGQLYNASIVRETGSGDVTASSVTIQLDNLVVGDTKSQIDALLNQQAVSEAQPANEGKKYWSFFNLSDRYFVWSFFAGKPKKVRAYLADFDSTFLSIPQVAPQELMKTIVSGIIAVSVVSILFIPHWTAVVFVAPLISILFVDLLGVLQWAGISVNALSYISMVMSVGLMVDFLMHILLRYFESYETDRKEKVKDTIKTMGGSIFIGGLSTFLGEFSSINCQL